ncbi:glycosyltransferase family 4 protein [Massilibacterium senegalense]|uniref:glycosyltransferase family 4 protein n=1 Tax=Massilibacterium senegalense TaxID=1632858 RepID=UPI0007802DEA|nr:glycosyltransferase family 4 protein [Massilibacterium senegalense]
MKKHILVISQYFYPEQFRINDICEEWVKRGYKVTVLTGIPNYPQGKFYKGHSFLKKRKEIYKGIEIIRIPIIPRGNSSIMLALNYLSFVVSGFFFSFFTILKPDVVFIYEVSPMTQALPGVWLAKRRKIKCLLYVTDLWPENVEVVAGIKNQWVIGGIGRMVDYIYERCNLVLTSSKSFINSIESRGVQKEKLKFWPQYAEDFYKPVEVSKNDISEIPDDDYFNIIFAGNIGYAQGLDILPHVAQIINEAGLKVRFNIIGDGRAKEELISLAQVKKVSNNFNFIDRQPAEKIPFFMARGDAALICLSKNKVFEITIPAKLQSCLACKIPIIVSADGEVSDIILEAEAGVCSPAANVELLSKKIIELARLESEGLAKMAENGLFYYEKNFKKENLMDKVEKLICE